MTRMTPGASVSLAALGCLALAGWVSGRLLLASAGPGFIPMAPLTAIAFVVLAAAYALSGGGAAGRRAAAIAAAAVVAVGVVRLSTPVVPMLRIPDIEASLVRDPGVFGLVPLARISPFTAGTLVMAGLAALLVACQVRGWLRDVAGSLAAAVGVVGLTVLLGYAYETPLLYGGSIIPVALPTGLGLSLAGIAGIGAAGAAAWPQRAFCGSRASARLLRAFLPATVAAVLLAGMAGRVLTTKMGVNPAVAASCSALAASALAAALIWRASASIGGAIDQAEQTLTDSHATLEAAVAARTAQLARMNQELDAFASSVSHDLRAPLRHMMGFARLLEQDSRDRLTPQGVAHLQRIGEAGSRMNRLIDDLLSFSRTSQAPLRTTDVDLQTLLQDVMAETSRDLGGRVIEWHVDSLPNVPGDRALLRQALTNLLANAVKYTAHSDRARIQIGATPSDEGHWVVHVRDNGVGFDMAHADKLFGLFQRLHAADQFEGTGVGLANVRRIVERHGGSVWAEGEEQRGATFFLSLPARERRETA